MKKSLMELLACPDCGRALDPAVYEEKRFQEAEIWEGALRCGSCGKTTPIIEGIPRFIPNAAELFPDFFARHPDPKAAVQGAFRKVHGSTQERFGMEWLKYPGAMPEDRDVFLYETQIEASEWKGKRVLDAGCGMGRYSRVAHELGATVVALDLSLAVMRLQDVAQASERMHCVQGNLMAPPLKPGVFDIVYSVGVIHHTPSAHETFKKIADLVKPGGRLTVWVYGAPGRFKNFRTNPLRANRQGLRKFMFGVWAVVTLREWISDALRLFTVHLPHNLLYFLCYPLAWIGRVPLVQYLTFSVHPDRRVRLQENFDWLAPPYQSHHTKEELAGWFEEKGFQVLKVLPHGVVPKPGILGKKK